MSQAHKVVQASLNSISGQHSASFHNIIENVTDIFFPKWAFLEQCESALIYLVGVFYLFHILPFGMAGWQNVDGKKTKILAPTTSYLRKIRLNGQLKEVISIFIVKCE